MLSKKCYYSSSKRKHCGNQGSLRKERLGTTVGSILSLLVGFCNRNIGTVVGSFPLSFSQAKALQQAAASFCRLQNTGLQTVGEKPSYNPSYVHTHCAHMLAKPRVTSAHGCADTRKNFQVATTNFWTHPSTDMFRSYEGKRSKYSSHTRNKASCYRQQEIACFATSGRSQHFGAVDMFTTLAAGTATEFQFKGFWADAILFKVFELSGQLAWGNCGC